MGLYDAHNHLHDDRFGGRQQDLLEGARTAGVVRMVVNGSGEDDWPAVAELARRFPEVLPSFGCHPWYLGQRTPRWLETLDTMLAQTPGASVGEIGLDRWMLENPERWQAYVGDSRIGQAPSLMVQETAFVGQLRLAAERKRAASIHCLRAFGRLRELLAANPRPAGGFLLHSYGGPAEMVPEFVKLGAYFGFPGYFAHDRKCRQRETFKSVPLDRLLIETDAPDQLPPAALQRFPVISNDGRHLNHPGNLGAIYEYVARLRGIPLLDLTEIVGRNFTRLFGER
ncbi:MAG TPA: TatD family deoxyribonuclease [Verrucomicrobiales bacterium]|nr:TatD family deoxyribonuclease [Verrucomicrobiales bacterium]